jgi:hypothetical protein
MLGIHSGLRGKGPRRHPSAGEAVKVLRAWADDAVAGSPERFGCLAQAVNLGSTDVAPVLLREIADRMAPPLDFDTDQRMSDALSAVAAAGVPIATDVLVRAADLSGYNLGIRALGLLESLRSSEALDKLLELHARAAGHSKRMLVGHIERLARALAVRISGEPNEMLRRNELI